MSLEVSKRGQTSVHRRSGSSFNNSKRPALSNSGRRKMACSHNTDVRWAIITAPSNGDHVQSPALSRHFGTLPSRPQQELMPIAPSQTTLSHRRELARNNNQGPNICVNSKCISWAPSSTILLCFDFFVRTQKKLMRSLL